MIANCNSNIIFYINTVGRVYALFVITFTVNSCCESVFFFQRENIFIIITISKWYWDLTVHTMLELGIRKFFCNLRDLGDVGDDGDMDVVCSFLYNSFFLF